MNKILNWIMQFFLMGLLSLSCNAAVFNIVPHFSLPTTVSQGGSTQAYYTVTNTTSSFHAENYVKYLPPNVTQVNIDDSIPNLCASTFALAAGMSCILELNVTGAINSADPNAHNHLLVCLGGCVTCCAGTNYPLNVNVTPSQVAPTVSATNPTDGSINVPISTNIVITFSIPMNTSTLTPSNFRLYNPVGFTYVTLTNPIYSNSNKIVTFNTNTPLSPNTVYQIIIPAPENITSAEGVALSTGGIISSFTTAFSGFLCAKTWVLNAGNNSISACSSDSVSGAIVSCTGSNMAVTGAPLNNPTAMIWNGLLLSITNASGSNPLVVINTVNNPSPPFTASATGSNISSPTGLAALNGFGWIANGDSTLTYCTSAQTGNAWSGCSVTTPTNYPATTTSISVISGVLSNPNAAGVLYTANTTSNSISACPITNFITTPTCVDAGGSGFNQPTFVGGRIVNFGPPYYVLITNKGNNTVLRCTFDNQTFMLSNCTSTGSNFNQPVSIYESDNGFAYITNQVDNSITICTNTDGVLTDCNNTGGDFNAPVTTIVGTCG